MKTIRSVLAAVLATALMFTLIGCTSEGSASESDFPSRYSKCGDNPQIYDPALYKCKPNINPNGIYLKTPVSYGNETYEAVLIGSQTWMAKNLKRNVSGSQCGYGDYLSSANTATCDAYGRLYEWEMALNACPPGWHLPSNAELAELIGYVGDSSTVGTKLKATSSWNNKSDGSSGNGADIYGFAALAAGYGLNYYGNDGKYAIWWLADELNSNTAYRWGMDYDKDGLSGVNNNAKHYLLSVRCLMD